MKLRVFFILGCSIPAITYNSAAIAQTVPAEQGQAASQEQSDAGIADIVVTAQRRSESQQSVPIALTVLNSDQIAKVGLVTSSDLNAVLPGVVVNPNGARSPIYIRGVGNNSVDTSPNVLTFVDGIYQPFDNFGTDFSNVASIEVLKGPQGTLFGRNATGGVLQIRTKNPFDWQGLDVSLGYANYDRYTAKLYGSAKLSDLVAADISGFYDNQRDGWGKNLANGKDVFTSKRYGVRSKLVAKLDDTFTATLVGDYAFRTGQIGTNNSVTVTRNSHYDSILGTTFTLPSIYDVLADTGPFFKSREGGAALTLEKEISDVKLLSISSYRRAHETNVIDLDGTDTRVPLGGTTFPVFALNGDTQRRVFTQELQASGNSSWLNWTVGLYYYYAQNHAISSFGGFIPFVVFGTTSPAVPLTVNAKDVTNAYAAYGQGTIELSPATHLTLGARYTIEKRRLDGFSTGSLTISPTSAGIQRATFKQPNYRVALDHKLNETVLAYASWTRGFNAGFYSQIAIGGFNSVTNPLVRPEVIDAYEVGLKSDLLDRRLRVNVAAFRYDYSNLQQQIFSFGQIVTINAAKARLYGVELDVTARPVRSLTISVSGNYLRSRYRAYPLAPEYVFLPSGEFSAIGTLDAAGNHTINAPKWGLQASVNHTLATSIGAFDTSANLNYQSQFFSDAQNNFPIPGRTLLSLSEQWTSNDEKTTVSIWGKNLTNKAYNTAYSLNAPGGLVGNPGAPRTYGVTIGRKF